MKAIISVSVLVPALSLKFRPNKSFETQHRRWPMLWLCRGWLLPSSGRLPTFNSQPVTTGLALKRTFRQRESLRMHSLISKSLALLLLILLSGCERWELDKQMEALCKKDGGIKVYETVTLSASEFSNIGQPLARYAQQAKSIEDSLGPEYRFVLTREILVGANAKSERGEGQLSRVHTAIYRRSDSRLLGEQVWYARSGGDFLTFGFQPSGKSCPYFIRDVTQSIFIKGE